MVELEMNGGWKIHDGRGVPADAKPGVTIVRCEAHPDSPSDTWTGTSLRGRVVERVWAGKPKPWLWSNWGTRGSTGIIGRVTHYRTPSTDAAVETLKALADNPKRKVKEAMGWNAKRCQSKVFAGLRMFFGTHCRRQQNNSQCKLTLPSGAGKSGKGIARRAEKNAPGCEIALDYLQRVAYIGCRETQTGETEMDFHSDDFGTNDGIQGVNTAHAWEKSDDLGLSGINAKHFTQGFIHARQGRAKIENASFEYHWGYGIAA
jgi:hypothetical protein